MGWIQYLNQRLDTIVTCGENLHSKIATLIPQHPYATRERKFVNNCLRPLLNNVGLNYDQDLGSMPTMQLVCVVPKATLPAT